MPHVESSYSVISDLRDISEAYGSMLYDTHPSHSVNQSSKDLSELKSRLDSMTSRQISMCFDESIFGYDEMIKALMESGAFEKVLSKGSSRTALLTMDDTVLKIADNVSGLKQNMAESRNASIKNRYGCFAYTLWKSRNGFALEVERARPLDGGELEFEEIMGVKLDIYWNYLRYLRLSSLTPKRRDDLYRSMMDRSVYRWFDMDVLADDHAEVAQYLKSSPMTEAKRVMLNLGRYLMEHPSGSDFTFRDANRSENWGKVERNGETVCVIVDHGATDRILNHDYNWVDSTYLHDRYGRR